MTRSWLCCAAITAASALAIPSVSAQPAPAAPVDKAKAKTAKQYVDAGLAAQKAGDYDTALTMYQKAYDLVPHPVLIFNMAQADRLAGRVDEALTQYNKYLAAEPNGAQAQTAREFVAELTAKKAQLDAEAAKAKAEAAQTEAARANAAKPEAVPAPAPVPAPVAPPPAEPDHGRGLRLVGLTAGAVGVVGVGIGVGFALHGKSLQSDVEKQFDPSKVDAGHRANTLALVGTIAGGALIATGVTLYLVGHRRASESAEHVALAPLVSNQAAGLALSGAWQ